MSLRPSAELHTDPQQSVLTPEKWQNNKEILIFKCLSAVNEL